MKPHPGTPLTGTGATTGVLGRRPSEINITTNLKVKIDFTLPALSMMNVLTWKCHVGDPTKGRYDMILGQDILTSLVLNIEFSEHVIEADDGPFKGYTTPIVDLGAYIFKYLNTEKNTPE